ATSSPSRTTGPACRAPTPNRSTRCTARWTRRTDVAPSSSGSAAAQAAAGLDFELDTSNLRDVLAAVKDFSPKLARELRRELRSVGDDIIADQRQLLAGALPGSIAVTGSKTRLVVPKD